MRWTTLISALVLATGLISVSQADVYRSVDPDGRVHYTDRWVPGSQLISVDKRHPSNDATAARISADQAKLTASNAQIAAGQAQAATERSVQQDVEKVRATQCKDAKAKYQKAIEARRVFRMTPDGKKEFLSDTEAEQHRVKAREDMDLSCGAQGR